MVIVVYSFLLVMQDLCHQPYGFGMRVSCRE